MRKFLNHATGLAILLTSLSACGAEPGNEIPARDIMAELIGVNTAPSGGNDIRPAVDLLVRHLKAAGFDDHDIHVLGHEEKLPNLVVRLRSAAPARRPILLMAHLDVVEALPEDWSTDPFTMVERDGYYYGRGTDDNKAGAAILVANLIRYKKESQPFDRDLIVSLNADEETTGAAIKWLLSEHRDLVDAEFALNTDGGPILLIDGKPLALMFNTSEKVFALYEFEALDAGGHSSRPHRDSAISRLARALVDLQAYEFPINLNDTTREFFARWKLIAPAAEAPLLEALGSDDPEPAVLAGLPDEIYYNAIARTTCVATQLDGGHAENALPQTARALVNCRILPQESAEGTLAILQAIAAPHAVTVKVVRPINFGPPSPLDPQVLGPVTALAESMWPGIAVIPEMSTGASDGVFTRNAGIPTYTVSAIASDQNDMRAHGQDERIGVEAFRDASNFWYELVKAVSLP
ncbi:MAG: M20/M25/M40 family metallo-hydrolase [Gammaproteobacteria bacterium]|nr:M20/M25/M40 family metallo-hydrolase [Gammaproteobacteria bacterium]MDH5304398.1 M20/M25/M40 family metallo-hydrolase [Gammaproteobacteria bacterium]MDH5322099.1 M20/M25/M40 family metallo-hydrolase [Gammaproteobacteria bacterium]